MGKWEELEMRTSRRKVLTKFSPHELDIIFPFCGWCAREERKAEGMQRGMARVTAPATVGRDCPGARSAMADVSMIPSPSWPAAHAAGSHPWTTSSPSVETRVLSTSGTALSHRARDLTMAVSSHGRCFKLQQLASSAPRRILQIFLTRRSVLTHVWGCMMHKHNTSKWLPWNMHIARLCLLFLPTCAYSLHCDRRKRCVLNFDPHTFS